MGRVVLLLFALCVAQKEVIVPLPAGGHVALSTRGPSAFRVRFMFDNKTTQDPIDTPMVAPDQPDAPFTPKTGDLGTGITASFGGVFVSQTGVLTLQDMTATTLTKSRPLGGSGDICDSQPADVNSCTRVSSPLNVSSQGACCDACKNIPACTNWIFGHPGDQEGNCWLIKDPSGIHPASTRTLGGIGMGSGVSLSTTFSSFWGGGASVGDGPQITSSGVSPHVENKETYVPHYYTLDGYAALGVVNITNGNGKTNAFPAGWSTDGQNVQWSYTGAFELYLMPAKDLEQGTQRYFALTGQARIPPRYAFGFAASRWGWTNRSYIEDMLGRFRSGLYPIDSFITDFEWFTNVSDYNFGPTGEPWYSDFDFNPVTFPDPANQLKSYHNDLHFHMGGIRKPRLGNTDNLAMATAKGWILPGGELEPVNYADQRNINYSISDARDWYSQQEGHYLDAGVDFFWNDEGETDFYTFYWWNIAQLETLRQRQPTKRFFSINRAFTPGMARLGATSWTGDINPSWGDLWNTPGMMLNWGLAGEPYVACDIGGFNGDTQADLLARWYQMGVFMGVMRVHSTISATPHFPFLWPEPYASAMRGALNLRYQLLPYHYSMAHNLYTTGSLWIRPLALDFGDDPLAARNTAEWMDGTSLLVAPVLTQDSKLNVYLPAGDWYKFNTSDKVTGPTNITGTAGVFDIPVFVRRGSIVPLAPVIQYSDALPGGALEVQVYGGQDCSFVLTEDDGSSTAYESGNVRQTKFDWTDSKSQLAWLMTGLSAPVANNFVSFFVTFHKDGTSRQSPVYNLTTQGSVVV